MRIGYGTDLHKYTLGSGIMLGGVNIPCEFSCVAHSDGDTLLHALTDAILGACAKGDIGELFPDTEEENEDRDSSEFLTAALDIMSSKEYTIANIDCVIHAQSPKLSEYKPLIAKSVAKLCSLEATQVNIKAKTAEGLGDIGNKKAISAEVVVLIEKR